MTLPPITLRTLIVAAICVVAAIIVCVQEYYADEG